MTGVPVKPALLRWACERARVHELERSTRFPKIALWESGEKLPTFKQLEAFARATHVPFGYLFLPEPPEEPLPIADFREKALGPPSGDLLDTIYAAQRRQDWFVEYATTERLERLSWIGSATLSSKPTEIAARFRTMLDFELSTRARFTNWEAATKALSDRTQDLGVLVSVNGVVGSNTQRKLDPAEFRGFSLLDEHAPYIFINGADHKASHAFTLCHELAHLVLGKPGLSNEDLGELRGAQVEAWCDAVASEILSPSESVARVREEKAVHRAASALTREMRVSPLVAVRRASSGTQKQRRKLLRDHAQARWTPLRARCDRQHTRRQHDIH